MHIMCDNAHRYMVVFVNATKKAKDDQYACRKLVHHLDILSGGFGVL